MPTTATAIINSINVNPHSRELRKENCRHNDLAALDSMLIRRKVYQKQ
jgi:hypothetical protein